MIVRRQRELPQSGRVMNFHYLAGYALPLGAVGDRARPASTIACSGAREFFRQGSGDQPIRLVAQVLGVLAEEGDHQVDQFTLR